MIWANPVRFAFLSQPERLGFVGAPSGVAMGQLCNAGMMRILAPRMVEQPTWLSFQLEALRPRAWLELLRLGLGAAVGWWAEWWASELTVFLCGIICSQRGPDSGPCAEVAVTVLLRNFGGAAITIAFGFGMATPVRIRDRPSLVK